MLHLDILRSEWDRCVVDCGQVYDHATETSCVCVVIIEQCAETCIPQTLTVYANPWARWVPFGDLHDVTLLLRS